MKICSKCHIEKDESVFYKNKKNNERLYYSIRNIDYGVIFVCESCFICEELIALGRKNKSCSDPKEYKREYMREYQRKHPIDCSKKGYKKYQREYRFKNRYELNGKAKKRNCIYRGVLADSYIRRTLLDKGFDNINYNEHGEIIQLQKSILKLKREIWQTQTQIQKR